MAKPQIIAMSAPVDVIAAAAATGDEPAKLPTFRMEAYNGGPISQPWSDIPLIVDLEGMELRASVPAFLNHDNAQAVGHTTSVEVKGNKRLIAEGVISRTTPAAADVVASGKNGYPWQASIQASISAREFVDAGKSAKANGKNWPGPVLIARKTKLMEISFVDIGADDTTAATIAAQAASNEGASSMDLKARKEALLAAHPQHGALILAALTDGKDDPTIQAEIEAATVKAEREAQAKELADIKASADAHKAEADKLKVDLAAAVKASADKDAEIADLKAKLGVPPIKAGAGEAGAKRRREMSDGDRLAFIKAHGEQAYRALPY
jgi:phage head maturation protease